jgi:hypothetical protein
LPFAESWGDWLAALIAIDDVLGAENVVWLRTGHDEAAVTLWSPGAGAWADLAWATSAQARDRGRRVLERLEVAPRQAPGAHRSEEMLVYDFGTELLVGCRTETGLVRIFDVATEEGLLVLPHAWGGERPYAARGHETDRPLYALGAATGARLSVGPFPAEASTTGVGPAEPPAPMVWTKTAGRDVLRQREIYPGRSLAGRPLILDGASPRLLRYFARRGAVQVDALRSVEGTRAWLRELGRPDWAVLARLEEEAGGILLQPGWALEPPERIGPWVMHEDEASLAPLGLAESEDDPPAPTQPWPFVTTHGMQLAVIGLMHGRFEDALCVDHRGWVYYLDHEFARLDPWAATVLGFFEKRALRAEQFGDGFGVASHPAAVVPIALDPGLLDTLGLTRVEEASDDVSSQHASDRAYVDRRPQHACRDARTWLYSADHAFAVRAVRTIREAYPELPIQIRVGSEPEPAARGVAFDAADIPGVVQKGWWDWGQFDGGAHPTGSRQGTRSTH